MTGFVLTSIVAITYWIAAMFERYENDHDIKSFILSPFTECHLCKESEQERGINWQASEYHKRLFIDCHSISIDFEVTQ